MKHLLYCLLAILIFGCQSGNNQESSERPPNIVFILVDDLGKEWISCYGAEDISTPNIDQLASTGIRFDNVYGMPQCTPTRLTFLTGQYPYRHGWVNHWDVPRWGGGAHYDETVNPSIGREMKNLGYATCIAGKWQIDDFRVEPDALTRAGFDEYCMWTGYETGVPESAERYQDAYLFTKSGSKTYAGQFGPDVFVDFIEGFIRENADKPFFVYYPMVLTHPPLVNTPDESAPDKIGKHKAMVRYTDKLTGKLVDMLKAEGIYDNTVIIWTTDNGTSRGIEGTLAGRLINGGKGTTSESGVCLPFIVNWPAKIAEGRSSDALINFTDLYPTLMELAGVTPPKQVNVNGEMQELDGHSFINVLLDQKADSQREWILSMGGGNNAKLTDAGVENQYRFRDRVLRDKRFKLFVDAKRKPEKFIDLWQDPGEEVNLLDSITSPDRKLSFKRLAGIISSFPDQDNDPRYIPNAAQEWDVEISAKSKIWKK